MEKWEEYYTKNQIEQMQTIELDLLKEFIRICNLLKLEYVIYGGTLLGAYKYSGFIPWDDDIDVALPRESYTKFVENAHLFLKDDFILHTPYTTYNTPYPYTKLRKKNTQYVEYVNRNINIEKGIYIDIYPIDKIPDNEKDRKKQFKMVQKWINVFVYRQGKLYQSKEYGLKGKTKNILRFIKSISLKIFSRQYCIKKIDYYMCMYNKKNTKRYACLYSPLINNIYDKLYPLIKISFENIDVLAPYDYKEHLKRRYGNLEELPPENKRIGHIPYKLDFGKDR